ncbi:MAG: hypothetical protein HY961_08630 [Ignavibacteriae bacterium]|nr:hypothetical protein [Ignavibacteriota bacterium]
MKFKTPYHPAARLAVVALLLIVPLLAYLQYTWVGQLSEEEYHRMQNTVRSAAFRFSFDFDQEVLEILRVVGYPLAGSDDAVLHDIHARLERWSSRSLHPQLVGDNIAITPFPDRTRGVLIRITENGSALLLKDLSALAIPIVGTERCALVSLDKDYILSSYLPELVQSHFVYDGRLDYDLLITGKEGEVFFSETESPQPTSFEKADMRIPFLTIPDFPIGELRGDRPPNIAFEGRRRPDDAPPPRGFGRPGENRELLIMRGSPPNGDRFRFRPSLYTLHVKHRVGSLQEAVDRNRWRNLGISFGILLVLGGSIVFLVISAVRAQRLAQQQLEFVAGVSHELRTPLAVLKSAGENLADGVVQDNDRTQQYGKVIKHEVIRLSEMVENALAYAGIQSGRQTYELHPTDLPALIEETIRRTKARLHDADLVIESSIDPALPPIRGNAEALHSVFENLIANAIKYSGDKKWIGISAHAKQNNVGWIVEVVVRDTGIGIPQEDLSRIFHAFQRGANARDAQIQGSGLGLAITKHIIEAHGGSIAVSSTLNSGTEFTLQFPAMQNGEQA